MSNYLTLETLTRRITAARLNALCQSAGSETEVLTAEIISRAEAVIDSYAGNRYQTPLPPCELTEEWALCIAEYELYKRGPGGTVPAKIKESYTSCLERLAELAADKLQLPGCRPSPANHSGCSVFVPGRENLFDAETMRSY